MSLLRGMCSFLVMFAVACSPARAQVEGAARIDALWQDARVPAEERRLLDRSIGFAPPAIAEGVRWLGTDQPSWADLHGRVVVLQTWTVTGDAGRTAPARAAEALKDFDPAKVAIIALHTPQGADSVEHFLNAKPLPMPVALDAVGAFCDDMGIWRRPVTIVLDKSGRVRATGVALAKLGDAVKFLLAEELDPKAPAPAVVPTRGIGAAPTPTKKGDGDYPVAPGGFGATDLRGKKGPAIAAQTWVTPKPETTNKVVIVDFWATWCPPCIASIPHMNETQEKFKDSVVVIGISDEVDSVVRQFTKRKEMKYTVAADPGRRMMNAVSPRGIPHVIIMSPDGIVRWQGHPGNMSDALIQKIIDASGAGPVKAGSDLADSDTIRWIKKPR
jgi:cytochrome c biogenesis protein CcmG/thiol:disulfide interchange protein DsbE